MAWRFGTPDSIIYLNSPVLFEQNSTIWLIVAVPLQLMKVTSSYMVTWCPMITHSVPVQVQWHARSCCLNDGYLSAADSIALLQNLSCLCCYSPNKTCWRFHTAALITTDTSSPIVPAGLYDSRLYDFCYSLDLLKSPVLLWAPLKPSSFLIHLVNGIGQ